MTNLVGDYICYREGGLDEEKFKEILQSNIRKCAFIDESTWETVLRTPEEFRRIGVDYGSFGMKARLIKLKPRYIRLWEWLKRVDHTKPQELR